MRIVSFIAKNPVARFLILLPVATRNTIKSWQEVSDFTVPQF